LADVASYPDAVLVEAEERIRQEFETICQVAFVERSDVTLVLDGDGSDTLFLPAGCRNPARESPARDVTVESLSIDSVPVDSAAYACYPHKLVLRSGSFAAGLRNVTLTYTYGWSAVPGMIVEAALIACLSDLISSDVPLSAESYSVGGASWAFVEGSGPDRWRSLPKVNSKLKLFNESLPGIA
jgi:hypothetical protein